MAGDRIRRLGVLRCDQWNVRQHLQLHHPPNTNNLQNIRIVRRHIDSTATPTTRPQRAGSHCWQVDRARRERRVQIRVEGRLQSGHRTKELSLP